MIGRKEAKTALKDIITYIAKGARLREGAAGTGKFTSIFMESLKLISPYRRYLRICVSKLGL